MPTIWVIDWKMKTYTSQQFKTKSYKHLEVAVDATFDFIRWNIIKIEEQESSIKTKEKDHANDAKDLEY